MAGETNDGTGPVGVELAAKLVESLVVLNDQMRLNRELLTEVRDALEEDVTVRKQQIEIEDSIAGQLDVIDLAVEKLARAKEEGKVKFSMADFVEAYVAAAEEIDSGEDEDGDVGIQKSDPIGPDRGRR